MSCLARFDSTRHSMPEYRSPIEEKAFEYVLQAGMASKDGRYGVKGWQAYASQGCTLRTGCGTRCGYQKLDTGSVVMQLASYTLVCVRFALRGSGHARLCAWGDWIDGRCKPT